MIQANELRIGNLIGYPTCAIIAPLKEICGSKAVLDMTDCDFDGLELEVNLKDCSPVLLTPEILEKCGFNRNKEGWFLGNSNMLYDPLEINGVGGYSQRGTKIFAFRHGDNILRKGVQYLHQLQNLYFARTGEELNPAL